MIKIEIKTTKQILEESKEHNDFKANMESLSEARKNHKWVAVDDDLILWILSFKTTNQDTNLQVQKMVDELREDNSCNKK